MILRINIKQKPRIYILIINRLNVNENIAGARYVNVGKKKEYKSMIIAKRIHVSCYFMISRFCVQVYTHEIKYNLF